MKRDYTLYLAFGILAIAVLMLAAPQIYRLQNPITYNIPANPNGQPPIVGFPTLLPSDVITPTNGITPTITISPTETVSPTIVITPTETITPSQTVSPTIVVTATTVATATTVVTTTETISATVNAIIQNFAYSPSPLTVPVGTTVKWTQLDPSVPHTVSAGSPTNPDPSSAFNSPTLTITGTNTFEFTFQQPGVYSYYCTFHTEMRGSVIVTDAQGNVPTPAPKTPVPTATPFAVAPPTNAQVIVKGLINPRGFTQGPDGALYVAEAGTVPDTISSTVTISPTTPISSTATISSTDTISSTTSTAPTAAAPPPHATVNPICESELPSYDKQAAGCPGATGPQVSNKGRISRIAPDGTRTTVAENLPVTVGPFSDVFGVNSVAFVGSDLYVIIAAGASRGHPDFNTGVYRVSGGKTILVADLEAFQKADPPKFIPPDYNYTLPYDMLSLNGKLYITDGNAAVVFEVDPAGAVGSNIKRVVDLSPTHNVLTGIAAGPDGAIYFTEFTPAPYPVGGAQIFKWSASGGLTLVTKGLSVATGIALAADGTIYASEFATDLGKPPFIVPPGQIVKIGTDGKTQTVASPIAYPTSLRWLNGALYVTAYGVNAIDGLPGDGAIYKITLP